MKSQRNSKIRYALERLNLGLYIGAVMCDFNPKQSKKNEQQKTSQKMLIYSLKKIGSSIAHLDYFCRGVL